MESRQSTGTPPRVSRSPSTIIAPRRLTRYTVTPDGDFLIDRVPGSPQIIVASPCSGHGFKFAPAIGEILADLAMEGEARHDISRFRLRRFQ